MKLLVYIVVDHEFCPPIVYNVYATKELAKTFIDRFPNKNFEIREYEVINGTI